MGRKREPLEGFSDSILREAAKRFGVIKNELTKVHDSVTTEKDEAIFEKSLYEYEHEGKRFVLRLTIPQYVDFELIPGEVDWVNYLADNGVSVPRALPSKDGNLVEIIEADDSSCAAVSFERVEGKPIDFDDGDEWNGELFVRYGEIIGKMHALTKRYAPADESLIRMQWYEQDWFDSHLLPGESPVHRKCEELMDALRTLPKDRDSYGLIHGDAHPWNVLLHEGNIVLTDFDFCEQSWFASDIAIILFYAVMAPMERMDKMSFAVYFMKNFMRGYDRENSIDAYWLKQIPGFLRLRMISKYILHYPEWKSGRLSEKGKFAFMEWKRKIENDIPCLDVDFSELG
ncbi:MAG: phosphotransferase [Candidatus Zixiibacteriota bacterium]